MNILGSKLHIFKDNAFNRTSFSLHAKRTLDVFIVLGAIPLLLPIFATIAVLIKFDSRGPVIFKQTRIGKGGKPFNMYKFRSMYDADHDNAHKDFVRSLFRDQSQHTHDTIYKVIDDGRITRIGAFLRKTSLDELPQLVNVLKGEMSLVGPRPDLPYSVELYEQNHLKRFIVLPGITGLWQVSGRSSTSLLEMLDLDIDYADNWSFWLDIKILARTIIVVITGQGAS